MLLNKRISILYFINLIKFDLLLIVSYTILTSLIRHNISLHSVSIPIAIPALIGTLISLLLAFRTSQSYERWWEARKVWGSIVNDSRTLIRQIKLYLPKGDKAAEAFIEGFSDRQIVWVYSLGESLRKVPRSESVRQYLEDNNLNGTNIPNILLIRHAEELQLMSSQYQFHANTQAQIDSTLTRLTDSMGKCERIKNTVFPKSYSLLINVIIYVFITLFPFSLNELGDAAEIVLSVLIPLLFISIERTAIIMQDPFENRPTDTPMTRLAQTIEINLNEVTGKKTTVTPADEDKYYTM